jgi:hypothetical protein
MPLAFASRDEFAAVSMKGRRFLLWAAVLYLVAQFAMMIGVPGLALVLWAFGAEEAAPVAACIGLVSYLVIAYPTSTVILLHVVRSTARRYGLTCPRCRRTLIALMLNYIAVASGRCGRCGARLFPEDPDDFANPNAPEPRASGPLGGKAAGPPF